jgi:hypothetical protein
MGADVVKRLVQWFGGNTAIHDQMVAEMNERHFVARLGAQTVIGTIENGEVFFQKEKDLYSWYANKVIVTGHISKGDRKGQEVKRSQYEIWREHPKRRDYRSVVFSPPPCPAAPEDFNLWTGLAVSPAQGDCSLFLAHVRDNLCRGNEEHYEYLLDLCAFTVQHPGKPSEIATVFRGKRGTGKGMFGRAMCSIFGRHAAHIDRAEQIAGKFNAALSSKVVIFADEAFLASNKDMEGTLKRIITEPTLSIERKGFDVTQEPNFLHLFMAANEDFVVPAGFNERRFFVLDVSDEHMQDFTYFNAIEQELRDGGLQAFVQLLLERPVTHERVRRVPKTEALRAQQEHAMEPHFKWLHETLLDGTIDGDRWPEEITVEDLHRQYLAWCDAMKITRRITKNNFAQAALGDLIHSPRRPRHADGSRTRQWQLLPLGQARAAFDSRAGTTSRWPEPAEEPTEGRLPLAGSREEQADVPF